MKFTLFAIIATLLIASAFASSPKNFIKGVEYLPRFLSSNINGEYCATDDIWRWKQAVQNGFKETEDIRNCNIEGICDNYEIRNRWTNHFTNIELIINVLCASDTSCPVTGLQVMEQIAQVNKDYAGTGFIFSINETRFIVDPQYAEIEAYSQFSITWYLQIQNLKSKHAYRPDRFLNSYVTKQKAGLQGTLLGIGTFPWDAVATQPTGGLWMNGNYVSGGRKTFSHEIGHCVGLWHTFHGDSEVSCTNGCYETVHIDFEDDGFSNTVGDFCADTPSQPLNYNCVYPTTRDCKGNLYTDILDSQKPTLLNNIMSYTPDTCMQSLTHQQAMRAHCWTCDKLAGWVPGQCQLKA